jgi:hypothetical protein
VRYLCLNSVGMDRLESGIEQGMSLRLHRGTARVHSVVQRCTAQGVSLMGRTSSSCKRLRRKENVSIPHFELPSAQKSAIAADTKNRNNVNMLDRSFNIAPMMDWTD